MPVPPSTDLDAWLEITLQDQDQSAYINGPSGYLREHTDQLTLTQARELRALILQRKTELEVEYRRALHALEHLYSDVTP